ncbi:unnamed protein product [Gongylonema pulchrum]|uniref:Uncharacterized protein n=1 Tax=Gongylonema pulchrum TaxID=637853 RepID=A0A183D4Q5_9BILA|nr:unnamed protein product [Gongylonema pulchrum]
MGSVESAEEAHCENNGVPPRKLFGRMLKMWTKASSIKLGATVTHPEDAVHCSTAVECSVACGAQGNVLKNIFLKKI